jgi:hypothetical protein
MLVLPLLPIVSVVFAQNEPTAQEWKEIEADLARTKREKPDEYRRTVALAQMALGLFGFGIGPFDGTVDSKFSKALREYQRVRNLSVTGDLDAKTLVGVMHDFESWNQQVIANIILPPLSVRVEQWDHGFAAAEGTWIIRGEKTGRPLQTTEIRCYKELSLCLESTAILDINNNNYLSVHSNHHKIERWDQHEILTKPDNSAMCVRYTMRIGRVKKSVTGLRLRVNHTDGCKDLAPELHLELVEGWEAMKQMRAELREKLKGVFQAPALVYGP